MTAPVKHLLDTFDALPESDKHEAAVEILRRVGGEKPDMSDTELVAIADELFTVLDHEETRHAPR